jgi:deoxyhypusine synthase
MKISDFVRTHYRHFNAAALSDAAEGYKRHIDGGGKMLLAMAGAMSTAELGLSLAEMIRRDKVHAISCTGANLEEDVFNLVAHDHYQRIPNWRNLRPADEKALERAGLNRVTDTCIPEDKAFRAIEKHVLDLWVRADQQKKRYFPHEIMYQLLLEGRGATRTRSTPRARGCSPRPRRTCRSSCPAGKTRPWGTSSCRTACRASSRISRS